MSKPLPSYRNIGVHYKNATDHKFAPILLQGEGQPLHWHMNQAAYDKLVETITEEPNLPSWVLDDSGPQRETQACPNCDGRGWIAWSCCGDDITGNDYDNCPTCYEHCSTEEDGSEVCEECLGTGIENSNSNI